MRRRASGWMLLLLLIVGVIAGSTIGHALRDVLPVAAESLELGIDPPATIHLAVISFTFGSTVAVNLGSVIGLIGAIWLWRRM